MDTFIDIHFYVEKMTLTFATVHFHVPVLSIATLSFMCFLLLSLFPQTPFFPFFSSVIEAQKGDCFAEQQILYWIALARMP